MPNKLLKELQTKFKAAVDGSKEKEHEKVQALDFMETSVLPLMPLPSCVGDDKASGNEVTNLSQVSFLKRKLQKQFKEASRDSKDEKENREKAFEPIKN